CYLNCGAATMWLKKNARPAVPAADTPGLAFLYGAADRDRLANEVEAAAADKPPHADYASRLIAYYAQGGSFADEPDADGIPGLSRKAADALARDVQAIYAPSTGKPLTDNQRAYRAAYRKMRESDRVRGARRRQEAKELQQWEEDNPLTAALRF
ncbi:hypothetical protein ACFW9F_30200, partial [Streptomyces sp. NPDC059506]|uniref:hypothetical protein n=1 Tax=Streptomyces sp. NPDC059506 TaxID=3347751 RepID=UPI0036A19EE1